MNYLSIDVGTTACKCQLFTAGGEIKEYISKEYSLKSTSQGEAVDIAAIKDNVFNMIKAVAKKHEINSICISSFGETFVALDSSDNVLFDPMLYTDKRGESQAEQIKRTVGADEYFAITGTAPHAMYSVSKLLWIKENDAEVYSKIDKVLLICDYLGYLLTGKHVIDYALAARTGLFDVHNLEFSEKLCDRFGVNKTLFSSPKRAGTIVGQVNNKELNLKNCVLVLGSHDQVCTALGAGITKPGQAVDGMGTVECITVAYEGAKSDPEMGRDGLCCVPYAIEGLYCTYIVTYSSGLLINWFKNDIIHNYKGDEKNVFSYLEKGMRDVPNLFVLPYLAGAMIPYQDVNAKGAVVGLTASTTDCEIYRAILESLSMEMRFESSVAARYGIKVSGAVATGGGANSDEWLKIKVDCQGVPYSTLRSAEGGLCGCAVMQSVALDKKTYDEAVEIFVKKDKSFLPISPKKYDVKYKKYIKLYKALKEFF